MEHVQIYRQTLTKVVLLLATHVLCGKCVSMKIYKHNILLFIWEVRKCLSPRIFYLLPR